MDSILLQKCQRVNLLPKKEPGAMQWGYGQIKKKIAEVIISSIRESDYCPSHPAMQFSKRALLSIFYRLVIFIYYLSRLPPRRILKKINTIFSRGIEVVA